MNTAELNSLAKDRLLTGRFDSRIKLGMRLLIPPHVVIIFLNAFVDGEWTAACAHMAMAGIAWFIVNRSQDGIRTFIFTNVYLMFSFTTYFYAVTHGQTASYGLGTPDRSALVALVSQCGLLCAFLLTPRHSVLKASHADEYVRRKAVLKAAQYPLAFLGVLGIVGGRLGLPDAYAATLVLLLYVAMSIRLTSGRFLKDPALWVMFTILLFSSVSGNARTGLLALVYMLGFALLIFRKNLFSPLLIIVLYLAMKLVSIFSSIMLAIRWARDTSYSMVALFFENFLSLETLLTLVNPFHTHTAELALLDAPATSSGFYTLFFSADAGGLITRLTLLPQMDIVVSKLPEITEIRWTELWANLIWNILPSFGQQKDLMLSDQIVWELGLRDWNSVGRPMISAQGEIFSIGGYVAVFFVTLVLYYFMVYFYGVLARLLGSRIPAIMIMSQFLINSTMSTTLLSVAVLSTRAPLQLIFGLYVLLFMFSIFSGRRSAPHQRQMA